MARLFMDGFENLKPSAVGNTIGAYGSMWEAIKDDNNYGIGFDLEAISGGYFGGDGCLYSSYSYALGRTVDNMCVFKELPSTYNKLFSRFYYRADSNKAYTFAIFGLGTSATFGDNAINLKYKFDDRTLSLYVNNVSVDSVSYALVNNVWHRIEVLYDSVGSNVQVKVDGQVIINYSGAISSNISHVFLGKSDNVTTSTGGDYAWKQYFDDFAINDDSGTVNNSWIGAGTIRLLKPTSDDTNADFIPSSGTDHYALVDDFPHDGDATYNLSSTTGDIDTFNLESVPTIAGGQTINAVQVLCTAKSQADISSVAPILISGATTDVGAAQTTLLDSYYDTKQKTYDVDPNTSTQWTESNVNAMKVGYKNVT
jgi:hypothetical protein